MTTTGVREGPDTEVKPRLLDGAGEGRRFFGKVCSYSARDSYNTTFLPGAFDEGLRQQLPALCYSHDRSKVIGKMTGWESRSDGLYGSFQLADPDDVPLAREVRSLLRDGMINGLSIGFRNGVGVPDPQVRGVVNFRSAEILEVSVVLVPAVPGSRVLELRSAAAAPVADSRGIGAALKLLDRLDGEAHRALRGQPGQLPKPPDDVLRAAEAADLDLAWERSVASGETWTVTPPPPTRPVFEIGPEVGDLTEERPDWFGRMAPPPAPRRVVLREVVDAAYRDGDRALIAQIEAAIADPDVEVR